MAGNKQKLKLLYLIKIFTEDTDDQHALTLPQIAEKPLPFPRLRKNWTPTG